MNKQVKSSRKIIHLTAPTCICALLPAVMLEIVQQASFRMLSLELLSKYNRLGNALQFRITCGRKNSGLLATLAVKQVNPQDTGALFQFPSVAIICTNVSVESEW